MKIGEHKFVIQTRVYTDTDEDTIIESNCAAITFKNNGDAPVEINGHTLLQYDEEAIGGEWYELDTTQYRYRFGSGITKNFTVFRKVFIS